MTGTTPHQGPRAVEDDLPSFHLVTYSDAPELGGAEMNLTRVLSGLPASIRVTVVATDTEVLEWLCHHRPGSTGELVQPVRSRTDLAGLARHRAFFRRLSPDIVQFNLSAASSCQWAILAATSIRGLRRVVVENSPMGTWSAASRRLKRLTSQRLDAHVAVGDRTARLLEQHTGLAPGAIETIHHGVPEPGREPVDRPGAPTVLTVARHDPVKGVDVLLEAMARVTTPVRAVLIGSGPETASLQDRWRRLGLEDRVEFRDLPWDRRAADLMWAFDGLVLPSRLEGFPVTIAEAMLAGLPVVATDVGSVREAVVDGETGWVVPPEEPEALARAIDALASDLAHSKQLGEKGRAIAQQRFTTAATVDAYLRLYRRLLAA